MSLFDRKSRTIFDILNEAPEDGAADANADAAADTGGDAPTDDTATGDDNLITGKGAGVEYELSVSRAAFDQGIKDCGDIPAENKYYMGDEFQTSMRFYWNGWDEFSNMPNCSLEEEQGNGWGFLMRVKTFNK